jgi:hypothetical protein
MRSGQITLGVIKSYSLRVELLWLTLACSVLHLSTLFGGQSF